MKKQKKDKKLQRAVALALIAAAVVQIVSLGKASPENKQ